MWQISFSSEFFTLHFQCKFQLWLKWSQNKMSPSFPFHICKHVWFQALPSWHTQCFVGFLHSHLYSSLSLFRLNYVLYNKFTSIFPWNTFYCVLIHLFLPSYWVIPNLYLLFYWGHIFTQMDSQRFYSYRHICLD